MSHTIFILAEKFDWGEEIKFFNTIITSAGIVGLCLGSLLGGKFITGGRRKSALIMCLIAFLGGLLTQVLYVPTILVGRLMYGFAGGTLSIVMAKSIDETMPSSVKGQFGIASNAFIAGGIMLTFFMGAILPDEKESMK